MTWQSLTVIGFRNAMTIFAHPDDMEFSCGATLAKWAQAGCEITVVLCTSGNVGTHDRDVHPVRPGRAARREQKNACDVLGVKHIEFLRHDDSRLMADLTLRRELVHLIRKYKPEVVFCGDPNLVFWGPSRINHPDHRAGHWRQLDAIFPCASMELLWPEEGPAHEVHGVYVRAFEQSGHVDRHQRHRRVEDQGAARASLPARRNNAPEEMIRQRTADAGKEKGMAFAENFRVVRLKE